MFTKRLCSNPFDVTGARAAGLRAIWVDRAGKGWQDRLGGGAEELRPTYIVHSLEEVAEVLKERADEVLEPVEEEEEA